jgi:hypothetical protein
MTRPTLHLPPFPDLEWDDEFGTWEGKILLSASKRYASRPRARRSLVTAISGTVRSWASSGSDQRQHCRERADAEAHRCARLTVWSTSSESRRVPDSSKVHAPPTEEQSRAFQYLMEHEERILERVLFAIPSRYQDVLGTGEEDRSVGETDAEQRETDPLTALRSRLGDLHIHVLNVSQDGEAFIGYDFGRMPDSEYGFGVTTHRGQVIDVIRTR